MMTNTKTTTVTAQGITCGGCANAIKRALGTVEGVSEVDVDVQNKIVTVKHHETETSREKVVAAIENAGFPVS